MSMNRWLGTALAVGLVLAASACEPTDLPLPSDAEAQAYFQASSTVSVRVNGNVAEITVNQPLSQVRRGGTLWSKVGPYIYLFTEQTESLLRDYPGLAGARVITRTSRRDTKVAEAFLPRDALNELTWRRARNIAGTARRDGTARPSVLEDLVEWGQDHTEFEYNSEFVG